MFVKSADLFHRHFVSLYDIHSFFQSLKGFVGRYVLAHPASVKGVDVYWSTSVRTHGRNAASMSCVHVEYTDFCPLLAL